VIYNRNTHIFLKREEVTDAQMLLPMLMQQGLMDLEPWQDRQSAPQMEHVW
jgi:hypothetical protein